MSNLVFRYIHSTHTQHNVIYFLIHTCVHSYVLTDTYSPILTHTHVFLPEVVVNGTTPKRDNVPSEPYYIPGHSVFVVVVIFVVFHPGHPKPQRCPEITMTLESSGVPNRGQYILLNARPCRRTRVLIKIEFLRDIVSRKSCLVSTLEFYSLDSRRVFGLSNKSNSFCPETL